MSIDHEIIKNTHANKKAMAITVITFTLRFNEEYFLTIRKEIRGVAKIPYQKI